MTSVPKPLKFLRPHYKDLIAIFDSWAESDTKVGDCIFEIYSFRNFSLIFYQYWPCLMRMKEKETVSNLDCWVLLNLQVLGDTNMFGMSFPCIFPFFNFKAIYLVKLLENIISCLKSLIQMQLG